MSISISEYKSLTSAKPSKYKNCRLKVGGQKFDSIAEYNRYLVLKDMERNGEIHNLECQKPFVLFDNRKYIADFYYIQRGKKVVEDVKGFETQVFKIKRDLFLWIYSDIKFLIVRKGKAEEVKRNVKKTA